MENAQIKCNNNIPHVSSNRCRRYRPQSAFFFLMCLSSDCRIRHIRADTTVSSDEAVAASAEVTGCVEAGCQQLNVRTKRKRKRKKRQKYGNRKRAKVCSDLQLSEIQRNRRVWIFQSLLKNVKPRSRLNFSINLSGFLSKFFFLY
jgi:hypothetical protein